MYVCVCVPPVFVKRAALDRFGYSNQQYIAINNFRTISVFVK